jgi:phosphomannomutase
MSLIKSISGIRGTIGGATGSNLTPVDVVKFTAAYGTWLIQSINKSSTDATRTNATLTSLGIDVIDVDLSTTPTVEMAVTFLQADGGIILTASHNPKEWNALKLLNNKGEFISGEEGKTILNIAEKESFHFVDVDHLGTISINTDMNGLIKKPSRQRD